MAAAPARPRRVPCEHVAPGDGVVTRVSQQQQRILDVAEQLIGVHGFEGLRLRDIATECSVSIGTLQHHFATRDLLLESAVRAASRRRAHEWRTFGREIADPAQRLVALLGRSVESRAVCAMWLETCSASTRHPRLRDDVAELYDAWRAAVATTIDEGRRSGDFTPVAGTRQLVDTLMALIDGCMQGIAMGLPTVSPRSGRDLLVRAAAELLSFGRPVRRVPLRS